MMQMIMMMHSELKILKISISLRQKMHFLTKSTKNTILLFQKWLKNALFGLKKTQHFKLYREINVHVKAEFSLLDEMEWCIFI